MAKQKGITYEELRAELIVFKQLGLQLILEGKYTSPKKIAKAQMVAEEGCYMRDYVQDEDGNVHTIEFRYVQNR